MLRFFPLVFAGTYIAAVFFTITSQLAYEKKSMREVRLGFERTLGKTFVYVTIVMISTLVWHHMGWDKGRPLHLW
jgi:hypothetical protein